MRRADATLSTEVHGYQQLLPLLLPGRMDAVVYLRVPVEVETTLDWLDAHEAATGERISLFQVALAAIQRALHERPHMNRFVKGARLWQRDHVALTFSVKRSFSDKDRIVSTKVRFDQPATLDQVVARTQAGIGEARTSDAPAQEASTRATVSIPRWLRPWYLRAARWLDTWGLLPASVLDGSTLHTSIMVSNLGSLGLSGAAHHLYEFGTCSINLTLGHIHRELVVDDDGTQRTPRTVEFYYAYDERICDGFYAATSIRRVTELVQDPAQLLAGR